MTDVILDIETIPDLEFGKKHMNLDGLPDEDIIRAMTFRFLQQNGSEFPPLNMHKIVSVSSMRTPISNPEFIEIHSLSIEQYSEREILEDLHQLLDQNPLTRLITWNGQAFDIPVLITRSMIHGLSSSDTLLSKERHLDLKEKLSLGHANKLLGLDTVSKQLGSSGKPLSSGKLVWDLYENKEFKEIVQYCESDVINTYLIYLNYQLFIKEIDSYEKEEKIKLLIDCIKDHNPNHLAILKNHKQ